MNNVIILILILILILIICLLFYNNQKFIYKYNYNNQKFIYNRDNKLCVIYNYYEKNDLYKSNFIYFLNNGMLEEIDYYIIINGMCSVNIPNINNINVYYRENIGYDFAAYSYIINNKLFKKYDYYFFINTSVSGPYLKNNNKKWYEYFIELFNEKVHLVGTSINICTIKGLCIYKNYTKNVNPHVQSMFFVLDYKYFNELVNENFFNEKEIINMSFDELIRNKEVGLSSNAINKGYNINSILPKYKNLDYININEDINKNSVNGDPYYKNAYFGETINPYDVIFYKTNRI